MNTAIRPCLQESSPRCYAIALKSMGTVRVTVTWPSSVDDILADDIIRLMRQTTQATPLIGFSATISDEQAHRYIEELNANLATRKCHLLAVRANQGRLIAKCLLRRNLNPNNRHIADLAKGMIAEEFRGGGLVLATAFIEIAKLCTIEDIDLLTLDVRAGTHAQQTWEHFGFKTYGVLEDYARIDGQSIAGHFMAQSVASLRATAMQVMAKANVRPITDDIYE
jgi:hypothetical protein